MNHRLMLAAAGLLAATSALSPIPSARADEPFRVGLIVPLTGPNAATGRELSNAAKLYQQDHGDSVAGRKIEVVVRDDAGVPDTTRRLAQELVVRDHVDVLAGFGLTPLALSAAPVATQARVPEVVMVAATSTVTQASPFIVRSGQTVPQPATVAADWAIKNGVKRVVTIVTDYAPGVDAETWFSKQFKAQGGEIVASLRVPLANPDFAPFLQKVKDLAPDTMFAFVPAGYGGVFVKQFVERGMDKSGIRFLAMGDVTDDDLLNGMGDVVTGVVTAGPYSAAHDSPLNKQFVAAYEKAFSGQRPNFVSVFGYDGMALIYKALEKTGGHGQGMALVDAMKGQAFESPRGPISIDPDTRDIVQNIYMRRVGKIDGQLYNVEFQTFPDMKDPAKAAQK